MSLIAFASCKGGVGQTSIVANAAVALASLGRRVVVLDLCSQNSLMFHLGLGAEHSAGWVDHVLGHCPEVPVYKGFQGIDVIPYGVVDYSGSLELQKNPSKCLEFLEGVFKGFQGESDRVCLVDVPFQSLEIWTLAAKHCDRLVAVLLADASSYLTLPMLNATVRQVSKVIGKAVPFGVLLNQVSPLKELSEDVLIAVHSTNGDEFLGSVHVDFAMGEALAHRTTVYSHSPESQAFKDIVSLSHKFVGAA